MLILVTGLAEQLVIVLVHCSWELVALLTPSECYALACLAVPGPKVRTGDKGPGAVWVLPKEFPCHDTLNVGSLTNWAIRVIWVVGWLKEDIRVLVPVVGHPA